MANEASPKGGGGERLGSKCHDGQRPKRIGKNWLQWLWIVGLLITIIAIVLLILSYFYPDTRFAISNML